MEVRSGGHPASVIRTASRRAMPAFQVLSSVLWAINTEFATGPTPDDVPGRVHS